MCFLKITHQCFNIQSAFQPLQNDGILVDDQSVSFQGSINKSENCYQILELFAITNSKLIQQINDTLSKNMEKLSSLTSIADEMSQNIKKQQPIKQPIISSVDPLIYNAFGQRHYKHRLALLSKTPKTFYKERNFDLNIALKNQSGDIIHNANTISIYFGVMTDDGQWVEKNKQGQSMIKGLNQIDLIHGKATFEKIYFREISSYYPNKRLNLVIYPKESLLKYVNCTNIQQRINEADIEPLLIKNITILSKRK